MEQIEDIVLRYSKRGMTEIRPYVSADCCHKAANEILSWEKGNVFLTTGFYVAGHAETDGPAGTAVLAYVLKEIGFRPVILTDEYCRDFFETLDVETVYIPFNADEEYLTSLVRAYEPKGMISIERCGINRNDLYANMRGVSISEHTAPIDRLFLSFEGIIPTIGVGDGGNEIGMGKIAGAIRRKLSLEPCVISTDVLVIASVSNWGAYGIAAALGEALDEGLLPDIIWLREFLAYTVSLGSVDGVSRENVMSVDGYGLKIEEEIFGALKALEVQYGCREIA